MVQQSISHEVPSANRATSSVAAVLAPSRILDPALTALAVLQKKCQAVIVIFPVANGAGVLQHISDFCSSVLCLNL